MQFIASLSSGPGNNTHNNTSKPQQKLHIMATGGGSYKFYDRIREQLGVEVTREDEMECLIAGLDFFINEIPQEVFCYSEQDPMRFAESRPNIYPYLLVNIGSGVSMIKVTGPQTFERIGGSSLGGGTLWGLLSLLTNARSYDDMLEMAARGENTNVDMLVGDIYGTDYPRIGLKATTIASSFGKVFKQVRNARHDHDEKKSRRSESDSSESPAKKNRNGNSIPSIGTSLTSHAYDDDEEDDGYDSAGTQEEKFARFHGEDISRSLLYAISNNIGQIAYLQARNHGLEHIYFGGSYICGHPITMHTLSYAINFWSQGEKTAYFLRHEGYLGAVGAFIKRQPSGWGRRYSGTKSYEDLRSLRTKMETLSTNASSAGSSTDARPATATSASNGIQ